MTPHPTLAEIIEATAAHEGVLPGDIIGEHYTPRIVKARRIAALLMKSKRNMSAPEIAAALGYASPGGVLKLWKTTGPEVTAAADRVTRIIEHTRRKLLTA